MGLDDHRATGGQCRGGIATGHRECQREVRRAEYGYRAQADLAQAQVRAWRGAFRQRAVERGRLEAAVAHDFGKQFQLIDGTTALAFEAGLRQAGFLHRAFDQGRAQIHDAVSDGFEELGAHFQAGGAVRIKSCVGQLGRLFQVGGASQAERRFDFDVARWVDRLDRALFTYQCFTANDHFASYLHIDSLDV